MRCLLAVGRVLIVAIVAPLALVSAVHAGGGERIVASDGRVIHLTENTIRNLRVIPLLASSGEIYLWDEVTSQGERSSHRAVGKLGVGLRGRIRETSDTVELADFRFDPLIDGEPALSPVLTARPDSRLFLVQLVVTPLPELQEQILELGGAIHRYYTQHTMLVEMSSDTRLAVDALPFVRWVGAYHPAYRLESVLREALAGQGPELETQRYSIMLTERGEEAQRELGRAIGSLGGKVELGTAEGFRIEATLSQDQLAELVHDNRVHYIDRWGGPAQTDMDIVRQVGGADFVELQAGYTGQGVRGEILDTELRTTHQEWLSAPIIHSTGTIGGPHGTSVYSNVFAQGVNPQARGMAPDGQGIFFRASEVTQFGGAVSRHTIAQELLDPAGPYRAVFQTASVGNTRTLDYTTISAEMDDVLFLHQLLHTQSQSNAGDQMSRPQAWAKNIVAVGGFRHFNTADRSDDHWGFTASIGPAADGRIKPDLAFFYDSIFSARGASDTNYTQFGGTSSATPQTAGHFGLLFQMWHEGVWPGRGGGATVFDSKPHMATAKALMIHNAFRYE